jgi:hypothetical protein
MSETMDILDMDADVIDLEEEEEEEEVKSKWSLRSAIARVTRNGGKISGNQITIKRAGIKVLGAIDYLCNEEGFIRVTPVEGGRDGKSKTGK